MHCILRMYTCLGFNDLNGLTKFKTHLAEGIMFMAVDKNVTRFQNMDFQNVFMLEAERNQGNDTSCA